MRRLRTAWRLLEPGALALRRFHCPLCGSRWLVRIARSEIGVRCLGCGASAITLSMASVLLGERPGLGGQKVYELSARGPLQRYLTRVVRDLTCSEYFEGTKPGAWRNGVQCQDVQRLTYEDRTFDVVTSTEVFEHVADDRAGFAEVRRVLRPGGAFVFTVPISDAARTVERARLEDGAIERLLPAEYHDDPIGRSGRTLVFRDYGRDVCDRLLAAGFDSARLDGTFQRSFFETGRPVVVAQVAG